MNSSFTLRRAPFLGRSGRVGLILAAGAALLLVPGQIAAQASGGTTTGADLQMSGSASTGSPTAGDAFTYTFQVKNSGPQTAASATFTNVLNFGVRIGSATVNGNATPCPKTTDINGISTITCSLGDMVSGSQVSVVEDAFAPAATSIRATYDNTPSAQSAVSDPNLANNQATVEIQVAAGAAAPPPLASGPCATIAPQAPVPLTVNNSTVTLKATIASCSQLVEPNLVIDFEGGNGVDGYVFSCKAPQNLTTSLPVSYTLTAGASTSATCKGSGSVNDSSLFSSFTASGTGTATLYGDCQTINGFLESVSNPQLACTTVLATGTYSWLVDVPAPPGAAPQPPRK
jgi:uncharacterized repeat protein (TIGR01451 family)